MERHETKLGTRKKTNKTQSERKSTFLGNNISNYQSPESIVKILLDKIINLSIRQSRINKIDNQLHSYCFEFLQNQIEPLFEVNYMNYTKPNYNTEMLFWKNKKPVENQWIEIKEPETVKGERFEGAFTRMKEFEPKNKKVKKSKIKEGLENDNFSIRTSEEKESISQEDNEKSPKNKQSRKKIVGNENNENKNIINTNINANINNNKEEEKSIGKNKVLNQPNNNKANKKMQMFNFPSIDIPDIEKEFMHEEYDPPDVNKLRKEIEEDIKKKEREKKLRIEAAKIVKKKEDNEKINKKVKPLDSNKFTFDPNGKIISFKQYKLENLSKDFTFIRNNIKDTDASKLNKKKKISLLNESNTKISEEVIKNPTIEEEEKKEKSQADKIIEKKEKIIPSGSNFQIILPNIGVVIKENQKVKEGGREFNKFFNKYSINDYDKILKEYVPLQNKSKMRSKMEKMNLTTTNNLQKKMSESVENTRTNISQNNFNTINNNTFNLNYETINTNNPLLTTNDIQINNDTESNFINTSPYLKTSVGLNSFNRKTNNYNPLLTSFMNYSQGKKGINTKNSILMKKPGITSLKMEIDSLQDLRDDKTYYGPENLKQSNIFGRNFMKNYKISLVKSPGNKYLAPFNKNILTDSNWGTQTGQKEKQKENIVFARHHTRQQALRELGSNIFSGIKVKLPRDRKVEINK